MRKMTLKSILESIEGIQVEAKKPRYTKRGSISNNSRKYIITKMPTTTAGNEILESLLDICKSHGAIVKTGEAGHLTLIFHFQSWPVLESEILKDIDGVEEEETSEQDVHEQLFEFLEKEIDGLGIGMNVTSLGIAFASNEEDLKNLKTTMKSILTELYKG